MKKSKENTNTAVIPYDYIANIDCIEGMRELPDNCIDLIITDPPYNLSKSGDWKMGQQCTTAGNGRKLEYYK